MYKIYLLPSIPIFPVCRKAQIHARANRERCFFGLADGSGIKVAQEVNMGYYFNMEHWSIDIKKLKKDPRAYSIWKLEQMINFGLRDGKISKRELSLYWDAVNLDPHKRRLLFLMLKR